jgi:hypothetical protein
MLMYFYYTPDSLMARSNSLPPSTVRNMAMTFVGWVPTWMACDGAAMYPPPYPICLAPCFIFGRARRAPLSLVEGPLRAAG